ncbi:rCG25278, partial [Rattus norvegicus]
MSPSHRIAASRRTQEKIHIAIATVTHCESDVRLRKMDHSLSR